MPTTTTEITIAIASRSRPIVDLTRATVDVAVATRRDAALRLFGDGCDRDRDRRRSTAAQVGDVVHQAVRPAVGEVEGEVGEPEHGLADLAGLDVAELLASRFAHPVGGCEAVDLAVCRSATTVSSSTTCSERCSIRSSWSNNVRIGRRNRAAARAPAIATATTASNRVPRQSVRMRRSRTTGRVESPKRERPTSAAGRGGRGRWVERSVTEESLAAGRVESVATRFSAERGPLHLGRRRCRPTPPRCATAGCTSRRDLSGRERRS